MALAPLFLACLGMLAARLNAGYAPAAPASGGLLEPLELRRSALWPVLWLGAAAACLVPSPLLELRYFTVPLLVAHAHAAPYLLPRRDDESPELTAGTEELPPSCGGVGAGPTAGESHTAPRPTYRSRPAGEWPSGLGAVACLGACFLAADAALLFVFLAKPFTWPDGSTARFMW